MTEKELKTNNVTVSIIDANHSEKLKEKKFSSKPLKINYFCICLYAFLTGSDFALIIPTLWDRLHTDFNASGSFMGLVMSAYSGSGVLCGLIMGKLSDERPNNTKLFYLISIFCCVIGHVLYFIGINKYVILVARAISGICLGATSVALAYIAKTSSIESRTSLISLVMASRQLGLMVGPAFNLFLRETNFVIFDKFVVDRKSSPGLFMAVVWFLIFLTILGFFKESHENAGTKENIELIKQSPEIPQARKQQIKHFLRIEVFVLLLTTFFTYFNQTSLETVLIPFTEEWLGWNELHNSILFCIGGVIIIFSYVILRYLTMKFADRLILLTGQISILCGLLISVICVYILKNQQPENTESINLISNSTNQTDLIISIIVPLEIKIGFAFSFLLDVLGLPMIAICSASLFTKIIDKDLQGLGQGIQRGILGIGTIIGPLFAGPLISMPMVIMGTCAFMILIIMFFVLIGFRKLMPLTAKKQ